MGTSKKHLEELNEARASLEKVSKELLSIQGQYKYSAERNATLMQEIEQVHVFLDALPSAPAKHPEGENYRPYPVMTRLALWMARKA